MEGLINNLFDYFVLFKNEAEVVNPSLPILYFGDLEAYKKSNLKIVTVGKNPSDNEFLTKKNEPYSFFRFPKWDEKKRNLQESLNSYFEIEPLKQWFSSFEPILNGLSASYYKGEYKNTAIHTDLCSPLATNPTWSKLTQQKQELFFETGIKLWYDLIEYLQPDILLVSIPKSMFNKYICNNGKEIISFTSKKDGSERKPYSVEAHEYSLKSNKKTIVIFGRAANKPFDTISSEQKFKIGQLCLK